MIRVAFGWLIAASAIALLFPSHLRAAERLPNIVFFLVDDLGWRDVGCFESSFYETPNIDRLAGEGMKITQAYAACHVCSPTAIEAARLEAEYFRLDDEAESGLHTCQTVMSRGARDFFRRQ